MKKNSKNIKKIFKANTLSTANLKAIKGGLDPIGYVDIILN